MGFLRRQALAEADATVVHVEMLKRINYGNAEVRVTYSVQPAVGTSFEAGVEAKAKMATLPQAGHRVRVGYDPQRPHRLEVLTPPGEEGGTVTERTKELPYMDWRTPHATEGEVQQLRDQARERDQPDALLEKLTQLGALRESGVLTEDEFEAQKARLLGMPATGVEPRDSRTGNEHRFKLPRSTKTGGSQMKLTRCAPLGALSAVVALLAVAGPAGAGMRHTTTSTQVPDQLTFDSKMVNQFAGIGNGPSGSETTEIQATIPLTAGGAGSYTGSAMASYAQATGTITETCTAGGTTGTTEEIEQSGSPTTFTATYTPGPNNQGGTVQLDMGPIVGGLEETFQDIPGCGGFTVGNTTPRFIADFVADHISQIVPAQDATFNFAMLPGSSLGGTTSYAGTYDFSGGSTNENLTYSETTSISVFAHSVTTTTGSSGGGATCTVPDVVGKKLAAATVLIKRANCALGTVRLRKATKRHKGHVLAQSPRAGAGRPQGTKVNLTVGR